MKPKTKQQIPPQRAVDADTVELRLPADPKLLKIVRAAVASFCEIIGFAAEESNSAMLAVDEACSNIIKHAYGGASRAPIIITLRRIDRGLEVVLRDYGTKADPKRIKPRPLDEIRPGGLGVHLIRSVMNEVSFDATIKDGNQLTLVKYLREA